MEDHLVQLTKQRNRLDRLIDTVKKSINATEGGTEMTNQEKFAAFKQEKIKQNEETFGEEIRAKYGNETIDQSNQKFNHMTEQEFEVFQALDKELNNKLAEATLENQPNSDLAQEVAGLHKKWLTFTWPDGLYDKEKHYNLSLMYVQDERFKAYYEKIAPGAAELLHESLKIYLDVK